MPIPEAAAWLLTACVALGCTFGVLTGRSGLALGILFAGASLSGLTAPVIGAGVRIEQPAVVLLAVVLLGRERSATARVIRGARWPIALSMIYLGANVGSAVLFAPDPAQSLKICLWMAISLLAALVAGALVVSSREGNVDRELIVLIIGTACLHSAVAGVQVVAELAVLSDWGVLRSDTPIGKAFGLAWEPNLLAIHLAAALTFLLDPADSARFGTRFRNGALLLISVGIALSLSRGGLIALAAGATILLVSLGSHRARNGDRLRLLRDSGLALAIAVGGYIGLSWLAASGVGLRPGEIAALPEVPQGTLVPLGSARPAGSPPSIASPGGSQSGPASQPGSTAKPSYVGAGDTIELRWRNLQIAVMDAMTSPLLGLGPDTFGQRYVEPTCDCPAHIPSQLSATFYESGIIGLASLVIAIGWVLVRAWRIKLYAYVAAIVALMVGFQFTDALRFGATWVLIGTMIGLIVRDRLAMASKAPRRGDTR